MPLLRLEKVTRRFGGITAAKDVSFSIGQGQLFGLIGPNGAGKTTLFNLITGIYQPQSGDILLEGETVVGLPPHKITNRGIARTFQTLRLFLNMSVIENVMA